MKNEPTVTSKLELEYNSAYISMNLIDELDSVIGGYSEPTIEFLFSLNTFVESFVLNEHFYCSVQEVQHAQIVSNVLFPNGRPVLSLIVKTEAFKAIDGLCTVYGRVAYLDDVINNDKQEIERTIDKFRQAFSDRIKTEYFIKTDINREDYELKYLGLSVQDNKLIVVDFFNKHDDIIKNLFSTTENTNIQTTLPLYTYKSQFNELHKYGISNEVFHKLVDLHNNSSQELNKYFGFNYQAIPPLLSILLNQSKSIDDIPDKLLQLRMDFKTLRQNIIDFEKRINESTSIKEQIKYMDEFNKYWATFVKKYEIKSNRLIYNCWDIAKDSDYDKSIDNAIDNNSNAELLKDLNLGKIGGKVMGKAISWLKEKRILNRFKGITNAWDLFENRPVLKQQYKDINRVLGLTISDGDLVKMETFLNSINRRK